MTTIGEWLKSIDLAHYASIFVDNEVDFETLRVLTEADLEELGLPFGPRKRIVRSIEAYNRQLEAASAPAQRASATPPTTPGSAGTSERRQLTVMFCDMVGFTELASRVDPEVLQTIIQTYEEACVACIGRYDGHVFQRLGDGIVAFFGFPIAHEDEAERAIHAGLRILDTLADLKVPVAGRLQVRIGIATGVVVIAMDERSAVGETMNLAARLQAIAKVGSIAVSDRVHRLAAGVFDYLDLGPQLLKGISARPKAFEVVGRSAAASRFEAATHQRLSPLVGRESESELLWDLWQSSQAGSGHCVVLSGEPGIGKSRIVQGLREQLESGSATALSFQCSPYHINSAFHPSTEYLERSLAFDRSEPTHAKLDKLEAYLTGRHGRPITDARFLAALLSIPCDDRYGPLTMSPQRRKEETLRALVDLIEATARGAPVFMLFEDVHWADPTSLKVLELLVDRINQVPLLAVLTTRPEWEPLWREKEQVTSLHLSKLTRQQSASLVERLAGGRSFPPQLVEQILAKTDGIPLFVEELTRSILESGALKENGGRLAFAGGGRTVTIPATLRDLLTARIDRLGDVKELAQVGATIGREFSYEQLSAVTARPQRELADGLLRLTQSGLAYQTGAIPDAAFTFKHALVQDTAYETMLKSRRKELHGAIARAFEQHFPDTANTEPELLAQHYSEAGLAETALPFWKKAGQLAWQRFAVTEAVAHLTRGLETAGELSKGQDRDGHELGLGTLLGPALVAQRGWGSPEVHTALSRAWELAKSLDHRESFLPVLHGLWVHFMTTARLTESMTWARVLYEAEDGGEGGDLALCGRRAMMTSSYWLGDLVGAREHGDVIRATYDADRHWHIVTRTNADPFTADGMYRGQFLWMMGYPDQACAVTMANHEHARRRNHPFDLALGLTLGAEVFDFRDEPHELMRCAEEAKRVGRENGISLMSEVLAEVSVGIAMLRAGRALESVDRLGVAIERMEKTGQNVWVPYLKALVAQGAAESGDLASAAATIEQALSQSNAQKERSHLAEILRIKGSINAKQGDLPNATAALESSLAIAREQRAKSWELRTATTLGRLLVNDDKKAEARKLLAPIYFWFGEGFGTKDLKEAKRLLDQVGK